MKKLLVTICLFVSCSSQLLYAQTKDSLAATKKTETKDSAPYMKYPELPAFNILATDSTTLFNTFNIPRGRPSALLFFDPDCKHCKATIKAITQNMDSLSQVEFYIFSARHDMAMIRDFAETYKLNKYPNIKMVGMDKEFFFFSYYKTKFVPDMALYDSNKKLIKLLEGEFTVRTIWELTHTESGSVK